jgi:hypothetical protein
VTFASSAESAGACCSACSSRAIQLRGAPSIIELQKRSVRLFEQRTPRLRFA